jgi:predicted dehydrogenase
MSTRRDFLQKLSLGASAALLNPLIANCAKEPKKLGVALVGLGNYAHIQLAPALLQSQNCYLAGIVTGSPEKIPIWTQKYGIPAKNVYNYQSFDNIRDNPDIDIVYIVLPNSMHAEYTIRAAKAGKHVICEKPMAMNVKEATDMIAACQKAGVFLSVGYRLYFEPHHIEMRRLGTEKTHGAIKILESSLGYNMADPKSWRLNKDMGGGGAIMDLGVYCILGARRTLDELPIAVTAQGYNSDPSVFKGIYEMMTFQMRFPSGAVCNSTTTYTSFTDRLYASTGSKRFGLQPAFTATGAAGMRDWDVKISFDAPKYQQTRQMDAFAESIRLKTPVEASGEEGLIDMKIIEAIKESAETGKRIDLNL